jgi:hypothetical protein
MQPNLALKCSENLLNYFKLILALIVLKFIWEIFNFFNYLAGPSINGAMIDQNPTTSDNFENQNSSKLEK